MLIVGSVAGVPRLPHRFLSLFRARDGDIFMLQVGGRASIEVPKGYTNILEYYERTNPEAFSLLYDPEEDLREDERWIAEQCGNLGLRVIDNGSVRAYPIELIQKRLG